ncbi:MAG: hypothetical protein V4506_02505 [Bacteroidota bacterium]
MQTTIKSAHSNASQSEKKSLSSIWENMEFSRFGIIAILVVILGCLGGMAASFGAGDNILKLAMIAFPTIIALALILAVAPMKVITYVSVIALVLDLLVFIF